MAINFAKFKDLEFVKVPNDWKAQLTAKHKEEDPSFSLPSSAAFKVNEDLFEDYELDDIVDKLSIVITELKEGIDVTSLGDAVTQTIAPSATANAYKLPSEKAAAVALDNKLDKPADGTDGQVLTLVNGQAEWADPTGGSVDAYTKDETDALLADKLEEDDLADYAKKADLTAAEVGGTGKVITSVKETNGVVTSTAVDAVVKNSASSGLSYTIAGSTTKVEVPAATGSIAGITKVVDSYSATGTDAVDGKAIAAALDTLDLAEVGGTDKAITTIKQENGKVTASAIDLKLEPASNKITVGSNSLTLTTENAGLAGGGAIDRTVTGVAYEANGKLKVTYAAISIKKDQISDLDMDDFITKSEVTTSGIENTALAGGAGKTITGLKQVDGKISATAVDIQVTESQVTNLENDLKKKVDEVTVGGNATKLTTTNGKITIPVATKTDDGVVKVDDELSTTSTNPVQNKVVKAAIDGMVTKVKLVDTEYSPATGVVTLPEATKAIYGVVKVADEITATGTSPVTSKAIYDTLRGAGSIEGYAKIADGTTIAAGDFAVFKADKSVETLKKDTVITRTKVEVTGGDEDYKKEVPTSDAVYHLIKDMIGDLAGAMVFKGVLGDGTGQLAALPAIPTDPDEAKFAEGWECVVGKAGTYGGQTCEIGDYLIYNGSSWVKVASTTKVENKAATLPWNTDGTLTTIANVSGTDITVKVSEADTELSKTSMNPVQNKTLYKYTPFMKGNNGELDKSAQLGDASATKAGALATGESQASGVNSTALGASFAQSKNSFAAGLGVYTSNEGEVGLGVFNRTVTGVDDASNTAFTVGYGASTAAKNAVEMKTNGDIYVTGIGGFDGTNAEHKDAEGNRDILSLQAEIAAIKADIQYIKDMLDELTTILND